MLLHLVAALIHLRRGCSQGLSLLWLMLLRELVAFGNHEVPLPIRTLTRSARNPRALIIKSPNLSSSASSPHNSWSAPSTLSLELATS